MGNDQQNENATYKLGENNCKPYIWLKKKKLIPKMSKKLTPCHIFNL